MKKLLGAIIFSIILFSLNQGYSQPNWPILIDTTNIIIMQNSWIAVTISKATGGISSFIHWRSDIPYELLTDTAYFTVRDKRNVDTLKQSEGKVARISTGATPGTVWAIFYINFPLRPEDTVQIKYTLDIQALRWDAKLQKHVYPDIAWEANIDFSFPAIANMDYAFWTKDNAPFKLPITRTVQYRKLWDVWTVIPTIIMNKAASDVGLSFVSPFELRKPKLEWEMKDSSFIVANSYLRLSNSHPCSAAVYVVPHEADWRPGLAWIHDKYPSFFNPVSQTVLDGEGWHIGVFESTSVNTMTKFKELGVKWVECGGHPFFGLYAPSDKNRWIIIDETNDTMSYDHWLHDFRIDSMPHTSSYDLNKVQVRRWDSLGIQPYSYFQSFESWIQYADEVFPNRFAIDANGVPIPAWRQCYLMNPDPDSSWGKHIITQIDILLDSYPNMNGIFYDRDDYCDYAYNYSDGVTMIGPDSVYMLGFAQEKINDIILDTVHRHGKGVWTNGPTSVEVCDSMDGIMSENLIQAPLLQYLGIARPLILLPYDTTPQQTEEKLKTALWTGHFPSIAWNWNHEIPECWTIDSSYKPLFSLYKGKKWVLYPHALQLPEGIKGNIFQTPAPDSDYLVAMIDPDRYSSKIYPEPETTHDIFRYDRWAKVQVPNNNEVKYCYLLSGDYTGVNQDSIHQNPAHANIEINIPAHRVSSLIRLSKEPRYEVTRISSPVLVRGETEKVSIKLQNLGQGIKTYNILLTTNFGTESTSFSLGHWQTRVISMDLEIPGSNRLGEDTMKVIERNRNDTTVFTSWIVDLVTFQIPEKLFIHFIAGDTFPVILVNNTERKLKVELSGNFIEGSGNVEFDVGQLTLDPLASKEITMKIVSDNEIGKIRILAQTESEIPVPIIRPVERALAPDPPHDLFDDDFSSENMDKWVVKFGTWKFINHDVAQGSGTAHLALSKPLAPENWIDYKLQVNTKLDSSDNPLVDWIKSFIYFRVQNESTYYRFGLAQGFKALSLFKRINGNWSLLANCDFNVKKDVWYNLSAEVNGDSIKCFLDGNLVLSVQDATFSSGGIGIGVTEDAYVNYYDDVIVRPIGTNGK
jgi:hypothetical protein